MRNLKLLPALILTALAITVTGCADGNVGELLTSGGGGLFGLIILILDIWAFVKIAKSTASTGSKVLWCLLVFFFPLGGLLIWYFAGPKG